MIRTGSAVVLFLALAAPAGAVTLTLPPGASRALSQTEPLGSYAVPTAPWSEDGLETIGAEGRVSREAWQVPGSATTLQLLAPLRDQLAGQGYEVLLDCETEGCGGFDFRFETDVLPEPEMHVDLGDFRFLSARREGEEGPEFVTLLVSRAESTGYLQVVRVDPAAPGAAASAAEGEAVTAAPPVVAPASPQPPGGLAENLENRGRAVLADLVFETGSARLAGDEFASLDALAAYLRDNPDRRITLVGHTDASGSLTANIALSRSRARSVLEELTGSYGIPADQLSADGVGYLMPLASNLTEEGRAANRRVEAVLTSTD